MSDRLYLGTRKGLFTLNKQSSGWVISHVDFLGENAPMLMRDPRDGGLYVSLALGHFGVKLHRSDDDGKTWTECAVPVYPEGATVGQFPNEDGTSPPPKPASLSEIWALEPGGTDQPGRLWAGTIPGGLFKSDDRGESWELVTSLWEREERNKWFGGGKDDPGIHSICIHPSDSKRLYIAVSCGGVWETRDDGATWTMLGNGLRADYCPPEMAYDPTSQDAHYMVQCPVEPNAFWIQHHNGIFRSTDGAVNWSELKDVPPSVFGFAVCVHPEKPDTAWFVPGVKDECRVPVDAKLVVTRTDDGGQTYQVQRTGLPQKHCYDIVFRHALAIDATGERLAMGSSTGGLWITDNGGESWEAISNTLPQIYCVRFG